MAISLGILTQHFQVQTHMDLPGDPGDLDGDSKPRDPRDASNLTPLGAARLAPVTRWLDLGTQELIKPSTLWIAIGIIIYIYYIYIYGHIYGNIYGKIWEDRGFSAWWCNNHLEKWWSSSMGRIIPYIMENKALFETTSQFLHVFALGCQYVYLVSYIWLPKSPSVSSVHQCNDNNEYHTYTNCGDHQPSVDSHFLPSVDSPNFFLVTTTVLKGAKSLPFFFKNLPVLSFFVAK